MTPAQRVALPYVPALDGVRGVAVAAVLLFHNGNLAGGFLGVDLFFVLSGFLITSLLLVESGASGRIQLGRFWARRARRLFPALGGMLFGVALYAAAFATPDERADIRAQAWATMLYVPNWYAVFAERDYWELFRTPSPLQHTWSLGIEEQFYLVWPLALAGLLRWRRRATPRVVGVGSLVLAAASAAGMWIGYDPEDPSRVYYGTDTRAAAILLGAALAAWHAGRAPSRSRWARALVEVAGATGAVVLAAAWWRLDGDSPALYRGGFAACGLAAAAVIAAASHPERGPLARALAWWPLRALGIISYGVYLWHWPIYLVLDPARTGLESWALFGVRVAATLAVALASYAFVERPILRGAGGGRQWAVIAPGVTAAIVLAIIAATAGTSSEPRMASSASGAWPHTSPRPPAPARAGRTPVRVLVLGDSVCVTLWPGLEHAAADHDLEVSLGVKVGCERDSTEPDCPPPWAAQVAQLRPDVVLVAESGYWALRPLQLGTRVHPVGSPGWNRAWTARRQAVIDELLAAGAKRLVFTTLPCFEPSWSRRQPRLAPANVAGANDILSELAAHNAERVQLIDLGGYVCPENRYRPDVGSVEKVRVDGIHYSPEGSDLVGRWLAPQLARVAREAGAARMR